MATIPELHAVQAEVRKFIVENFLFGRDDFQLSDHDSFLDKGVIDSVGMVELVAFLQQRFGVRIADGEFVPENLDSIGNIVRFLDTKRSVESG